MTAVQQSSKVLVVGAGVTGAVVVHLLQAARATRSHVPEAVVWDKNNIVGGRMMARSFRKHRAVHVDVGAQYLTKFTAANDDVRALLTQKQQLVPFPNSAIAQDASRRTDSATEHAICPDALGFRSLVQHLLSDTPTALAHDVASIEILDASRIKVTTTNGVEAIVNDLVLTCPVPNVLSILEQSPTLAVAPSTLDALRAVTYSQRFAVAFLFANADVATSVEALGWTAKYVARDDDDVIRYLCWDTRKKNRPSEEHVALLVHTSVPFGVANMDKPLENDAIVADVRARVQQLLPFLPTEDDVILHRWRISQVTVPFVDAVTATSVPALVLSESPQIVVAGDAFTGSTFDNCLLSAKAAAASIMTDRAPINSGL